MESKNLYQGGGGKSKMAGRTYDRELWALACTNKTPALQATPTIGKTLGFSALAGLASEGTSQIVKTISGNGIQNGGFITLQNKIDQLRAYKHLLINKQKQDILKSLQTEGALVIKPS